MSSSSPARDVKLDPDDEDRKFKKIKLESAPAQQSYNVAGSSHNNTRIAYAVAALKERKGGPMRLEDLSLEIGWDDLQYDNGCQEQLKGHDKVVFDPRTRLFSYKAEHQIGSASQLLDTIRMHKDKSGGVSVKQLKESWNGAQLALDELIKAGDILPLSLKKEGGPVKTVFWNEVPFDRGGKKVDEEFQKAWHALRVPADVEKALEDDGLKAGISELSERTVQLPPSKKKGKGKGPRKQKITNTHMAEYGIDLSKDRVGAASSAKKGKAKPKK